jgi:hypothetical protein
VCCYLNNNQLAFYDFDLAAGIRNNLFTAASFYPVWSGIIPDEILSGTEKAFGFFSSINLALNRYNGSFPTTFIDSGLQWYDFSHSKDMYLSGSNIQGMHRTVGLPISISSSKH